MKWPLLFILFPVLQFSAPGLPFHELKKDSGKEPAGFAVVELFTSEGCSSCPAAEQVLAKLANAYPRQVYFLEFHVDYWNRLGWTDPFSSAAYSERQRQYSETPGADGVYTPQSIINGNNHLVGSNETGIRKLVDASLAKPVSIAMKISGVATANKTVSIQYECPVQDESVLNIALVQLHAQTSVRAGENNGRTLSHIQVVRDFITVPAKPGNVQLHFPTGAAANNFALVAYLQNKKTYAITGGMSNTIQ